VKASTSERANHNDHRAIQEPAHFARYREFSSQQDRKETRRRQKGIPDPRALLAAFFSQCYGLRSEIGSASAEKRHYLPGLFLARKIAPEATLAMT